jgi:hypothetical protein
MGSVLARPMTDQYLSTSLSAAHSVTRGCSTPTPAIRWQVLRDLTDAPAEEVAADRARVEHGGWGAVLLAARDPDGEWTGGACLPGRGDPPQGDGQPWTSTLPVMLELRALGLDPTSETAREMTAAVEANCRWAV